MSSTLTTRLLAALLAVMMVLPVPAPAAAASPSPHPAAAGPEIDGLIVRYRTGVSVAMGRAAPGSTASGVALHAGRALADGFVRVDLPVAMSADAAEAVAARLASDPSVLSAVPDRWVTIADAPVRPASVPAAPNDPDYAPYQAWNYDGAYGIRMLRAWEVTRGSSSVTVAVVDTGITAHPDLDPAILGTGADLITDPATANDGGGRDMNAADPGDWCGTEPSSWHGTHVAGTIAAVADNGIGVTGIAPGVRVLPVRVLGRCGGRISDVADGIRWAAGLSVAGVVVNPHPAQVINISLSADAPSCDAYLQDAISAAIAAGSIVVVAAGNYTDKLAGGIGADASGTSPANCAGVIAVAATGPAGDRASYSNWGPAVTLAAPGGDGTTEVWSTLNSGTTVPVAPTYGGYEGTSMATPHVAAIVALMLSVHPGLSAADARTILTSTASAFPSSSVSHPCSAGFCGAGIADARAALAAALPAKMAQTIAVPVPSIGMVGTSSTLAAVASSGLPVALALDPTASCGLAGSELRYLAVGSCTVRATSGGDDVWAPAETVQTIEVRMADPMTLGLATATATFGDPPVGVSWSSASGLPVGITAGPSAVCSYGDGAVTLVGPGTCTVTASTAGDATWAPESASASISVARAITINGGATATRRTSVTLSLSWPSWATSAQVASGPTFTRAVTISRRRTLAWTLAGLDGTKRVYLRFRARSRVTPATSASITLDRAAPRISRVTAKVTARPAGSRTLAVTLTASGTGSGLRGYQIATRLTAPWPWKAWVAPIQLTTRVGVLYVRVRDAAGNVSAWSRFVPPA